MKESTIIHSPTLPPVLLAAFPNFPREEQLETSAILKQLITARSALAELNGISKTLPNPSILISTLSLREARNSSEIEAVVTTNDALLKATIDLKTDPETKEVLRYYRALKVGMDKIQDKKLLSVSHLLAIHEELEGNNAGFRQQAGTQIRNVKTNEVIHTPPQDPQTIRQQVGVLERLINDDGFALPQVDPLTKMAVLHFFFEAVHPFYDGNGRTGRILNILYLVLKGLLDAPILYLSGYIIQNKDGYYRLLRTLHAHDKWEEWVSYWLAGVAQTSAEATALVEKIRDLMQNYKHRIRQDFPKIYSQDLLNCIFEYPYISARFLQRALKKSRVTAVKYLDHLAEKGLLTKRKVGWSVVYINHRLVDLLF